MIILSVHISTKIITDMYLLNSYLTLCSFCENRRIVPSWRTTKIAFSPLLSINIIVESGGRYGSRGRPERRRHRRIPSCWMEDVIRRLRYEGRNRVDRFQGCLSQWLIERRGIIKSIRLHERLADRIRSYGRVWGRIVRI